MATGQMPFRGESSGVVFEAIMNRDPVAPVRLNPELPSKLEDIISKSIEKDREMWYQNASEIRTDLKLSNARRKQEGRPEPVRESCKLRAHKFLSRALRTPALHPLRLQSSQIKYLLAQLRLHRFLQLALESFRKF